MRILLLVVSLVILGTQPLYASDGTDEPEDQVDDRWYTESKLRLGKKVFENNCIDCHAAKGQGIAEDLKNPLTDGSSPSLPLDGTGNTWRLPMSILLRTINKGGKTADGQMPAFGENLSDAENLAVIAYFQNWWPDNIYEAWIRHGGLRK